MISNSYEYRTTCISGLLPAHADLAKPALCSVPGDLRLLSNVIASRGSPDRPSRRTVIWSARTRDRDACPGALQLHHAGTRAPARVRLPGGMISARQLEELAHAATRFGSPDMELTSRGNIQLRAITDTAAVADMVAAVGLLPSQSHERVRNIVASPLSGRVGRTTDIRGLVTELDEAIQSEPALAELPGRFMFGLDDGRGRHLGTRRRCGRTLSRRGHGRPPAGGQRHRRAADAARRRARARRGRHTVFRHTRKGLGG